MEVLILLLFVICGIFIGAADAVAGGGNLFTSALLTLAGLSPLSAIATMQVVTLIQDVLTSLLLDKKKLNNWRQSLWFIPFVVGGRFIGAKTAVAIPEDDLTFIIGVLMLGLLFLIPKIKKKQLTFSQKIMRYITKLRGKRPVIVNTKKKFALLIIFSLLIGFYGGFYGGGVGILLLLAFYFIGDADILATIATVKVISIPMSLMSAAVYYSYPNLIHWRYGFLLILGVIIGSFVGVNSAKNFGYRYIRLLLYIVVFASAIRLLFF